ncbi:RNA polymerase recycling motor ATPase HelR [Agromyces sp. SYSU T00266]|uniref:RNA polymerase recycling motor ATPase HelR n=1 Tax=Agromyces zhanjiangensis TaxID=3158562 RepID=UPI003394274A
MTTAGTRTAFDLPDRLAVKAGPDLIADDDAHFARIAESLDDAIADLGARLDRVRRAPGRSGHAALERDLEVHRLAARLKTLRRFSLDLCLGRIVPATAGAAGAGGAERAARSAEPVYIGRLGLTDRDGRRLLVDWRAPAAEPYFAATHADPMGVASRRRYRWTRGRVTDYWDEVFTPGVFDADADADADAGAGAAAVALDDQSAFIASLGSSRSPRMRDVLSTIQSDQDAIIRAGSAGALVVDGGPGTGKTVVALHRAAYLLYEDPRLRGHRGGLLVVGPHEPYLAYVADVLPSLGEEGVQTCTLRDLVPDGASAAVETDPVSLRLKSSTRLVDAVERAVRYYEEPPSEELLVETPWCDIRVAAGDWALAFDAAAPGSTHNEARDEVWGDLLDRLVEQVDERDAPSAQVRTWLARSAELRTAFRRAWPVLDPAGVVADLWSVPAYLRWCAPWLASDEVDALQRADARAWTTADLPFLDAARLRIGDPEASARRRAREAALARRRQRMDDVVDYLIGADDSELGLMSMLRGDDAAVSLVDEAELPALDRDELAGPFAHVIVDEAQELTDAEWTMLLRRCPSRSLTIVGDRAQARHGFTESWEERLGRLGFRDVDVAPLTINYRTPTEVMAEAEPVIRSAIPDANVPTSVRSTGVPVTRARVSELGSIVDGWLAANADGIAAVIGEAGAVAATARPVSADAPSRVRSLTPELAKGLEFDLVVLVEPERFGDGIEGAVDRYVAMTRATQRLVILTDGDAVALSSRGGANAG